MVLRDNPFVGTNELQGLKIMMVFFLNWDLLDMQNKVLRVSNGDSIEHDFIISDLGATFGKVGDNNLPLFFRLGRATDKPEVWSNAGFIKGVKDGKLEFDFKGKSRQLMSDITVAAGSLAGRSADAVDRQTARRHLSRGKLFTARDSDTKTGVQSAGRRS